MNPLVSVILWLCVLYAAYQLLLLLLPVLVAGSLAYLAWRNRLAIADWWRGPRR